MGGAVHPGLVNSAERWDSPEPFVRRKAGVRIARTPQGGPGGDHARREAIWGEIAERGGPILDGDGCSFASGERVREGWYERFDTLVPSSPASHFRVRWLARSVRRRPEVLSSLFLTRRWQEHFWCGGDGRPDQARQL